MHSYQLAVIQTKLPMTTPNSEIANTIHHEYGNFLIEFEQLVLSIKMNIMIFFTLNGLKELKYLRIVLQDQTAYPLNNKLRSLFAIYYEGSPEKFKLIDKLFVYTNALIEKRNFIIHGSSFIVDDKTSDLIKDKIGKYGIEAQEENLTIESLSTLTAKVITAKRKFDNLTLCLYEPERDLNKYFGEEKLSSIKL